MTVLYIALYVVAALCFALTVVGISGRISEGSSVALLALGFLAWVLVPLIHTAHR